MNREEYEKALEHIRTLRGSNYGEYYSRFSSSSLTFDEDYNVLRELLNEYYKLKELAKQQEESRWISVEERLPKEYKCYIDVETGYCNESDNVLCCCKNEYNEFEYWIDYTIDGEWQTHEYFDGEKFYWQPLPALPDPYKGEIE